jgi:hypothetical protein
LTGLAPGTGSVSDVMMAEFELRCTYRVILNIGILEFTFLRNCLLFFSFVPVLLSTIDLFCFSGIHNSGFIDNAYIIYVKVVGTSGVKFLKRTFVALKTLPCLSIFPSC